MSQLTPVCQFAQLEATTLQSVRLKLPRSLLEQGVLACLEVERIIAQDFLHFLWTELSAVDDLLSSVKRNLLLILLRRYRPLRYLY